MNHIDDNVNNVNNDNNKDIDHFDSDKYERIDNIDLTIISDNVLQQLKATKEIIFQKESSEYSSFTVSFVKYCKGFRIYIKKETEFTNLYFNYSIQFKSDKYEYQRKMSFKFLKYKHYVIDAFDLTMPNLKKLIEHGSIKGILTVKIFSLKKYDDKLFTKKCHQDIISLLIDKRDKDCDVILRCIDGDILAHRFILTLHSQVFKNMLESSFKETIPIDGKYIVECKDTTKESLSDFIDLMYGKVSHKRSRDEIHHLADYYTSDYIKKNCI